MAIAPGCGAGWVELDPDADQPAAKITLQPEQVIEGRLLDMEGRPAQGVVVSVSAIWRVLPVPPLTIAMGQVIERAEGQRHWWGQVNDLPGWPKPATHRRRRPLRPARHRPRPARQPERPRSAVHLADDRRRYQRPRGREALEEGAPARPDRQRARDLCGHRQARPARRGPRRRQRRSGRRAAPHRPRRMSKAGSEPIP